MQQVLEIPGYFYDKEKKKYFKIQHPGSSNAAYSSHHVKRLKLSDEREEAKQVALTKHHGRIKRSAVLEKSSMGGLMARSSGQIALDAPQIFATGLVGQGEICRPLLNNNSVFAIDPRPERYGMQSEIWTASHQGLALIYTQLGMYNGIKFGKRARQPPTSRTPIDLPIKRVSSNVGDGLATSMSINESCRQVAMTWLADDLGAHTRIRICHLTSFEGNALSSRRVPANVREDQEPTLSGGFHNEGDVHTSAAASSHSPLRFAFGTHSGILTIDKSASILTTVRQAGRTRLEADLTDIFALDFLDDNLLLSGSRKGRLNITDLRDPRFDSTANIIYHPITITHIRHLDQNRVLVAGLNSSLCQYDLRYIKQDTFILPAQKKSRKRPSPIVNYQTRPILTYPEYYNTATINIGLDIDLEAGIVAAAQEYEAHLSTVQLFSLSGGHKLRCKALEREFGPETDKSQKRGERDLMPIRCLRFSRDVEGKMRSLYVGAAQGIRRYAWAESEAEHEDEEMKDS